jgi:hypothetical protein
MTIEHKDGWATIEKRSIVAEKASPRPSYAPGAYKGKKSVSPWGFDSFAM